MKIYDVIIIGTGVAGLSGAIHLKKAGKTVLVLTKNQAIEKNNTHHAQGGIIAYRQEDTEEQLVKDILTAGCHYNSTEAVRAFAKDGPKLVFDFLINEANVPFNKNNQGNWDYTEEAAHSIRRILHYEDRSGEAIQTSLIKHAQDLGIEIKSNHTAIDLISNNHHSLDGQERYRQREVMGVYTLNNETQEVITFLSQNVILATGGVGYLYQHTTNNKASTGDGMSMAYRTGADIINSEFVQFHPTSLFHRDIKGFLISESLRGEGAKLINHEGRTFMSDYHPDADLAPRDVVARAIYNEMTNSGKNYMFLDLASYYEGEVPIEKRFTKIFNTCLSVGIDIRTEPIPIVPAAHYFCGGIKVNTEGQTSIKNLYAVGEVSCTGLHGANRLASSSLLEGALWGKYAADSILAKSEFISKERFDSIPLWETPTGDEETDPLLLKQDLNLIQLTMWNYVGIVRDKRGLERAKADLDYHGHRIMKFYKEAPLTRYIIELRNAVISAGIITTSALHNKQSIGCHYRQN
ncbi:L-aspartate oxidase [Spirochaeta cellobiosiphila]|uniref:L-aspartate oxidase n=1 Tax=Spirochaeta cellobiosiphila TaxID=504483 RepID=UPI000410D184|nr:L-aspartate oxidase [Spirochaeta cellobiosiphila]